MADVSFLHALLAVDPLQTMPADSPSGLSDLVILPQAEPPVQVLLLFAQLLPAAAVDCSRIPATSAAADDIAEAEKSLHSAVTSRLEQLKRISCCTPLLPADPTPHGTSNPQALFQPSRRVTVLRSLVLFWKLATLMFSVKEDTVPGQLDSEMPGELDSEIHCRMWHVVTVTTVDFLDVKPDGTFAGGVNSSPEEQTLCVVLSEHAAAILHQALKEPGSGKARGACLQLLSAVLPYMLPELLRQEVKG